MRLKRYPDGAVSMTGPGWVLPRHATRHMADARNAMVCSGAPPDGFSGLVADVAYSFELRRHSVWTGHTRLTRS